jgi:hypothetical protein
MKNEENKNLEGQETGEQQESKKSKMGVVKKVFTIGEKIVMGGLTILGGYALYKAVKPEPKASKETTE